LAVLSGSEFQAEVAARLQAVIPDFQTVPAKPQGDAGLDGLSHRGDRAYCCYGLEKNEFKTDKDRVDAIVKKFRSDLRRLFELDYENKKLTHSDNAEIPTILPDGCKVKHIELIANWFESHRVLNPLLSSTKQYAGASKCNFVEQSVTVTVIGPNELANRYAVDEVTIARARQRVLIQKVEEKAEGIVLAGTTKFDKKISDLKEILPYQQETIEGLAAELQTHWRTALALEQELNETLPDVHRSFEAGRRMILTRVSMLMVSSGEPWKELRRATEVAEEILRKDLEKLVGRLIQDVSSGEVARLIGECPVGWKKDIAHA
jgi:hypothetical protein